MRRFEFAEVRGDPQVSGSEVRIAGRCYRGPVRVGDVFTEAVTGGETRQVELRLTRVLGYGQELDELDEGQTAELTLSGRGARQVVGGVLLRGEAQG